MDSKCILKEELIRFDVLNTEKRKGVDNQIYYY